MPYHVDAIAREADPNPWEFEFGGETYTLPSDLDMRAMAALNGGRLDDALRILIGPEQWERMQASSYVFGPKQLNDLMQTYLSDLGIDLGKPLPSTDSSPNTPTPLRRTYNATTASV